MSDDEATHTPRRVILLTGFPSFAARYLLWLLAEQEPESTIHCLVPSDEMERSRQLLEERGLTDSHDIRLLESDISALDMGLSGQEYLELTRHVTDIYHLAGIWHTRTNRRLLHKVHVVGTGNVLQCAQDAKNLNRLNHFSTAHVHGQQDGVVMEEELSTYKEIARNAYEQSQFEAERRVRAVKDRIPLSIYRPSFIVGHSQTGQIDHLTGPYLFFKPLVTLSVDVPLPMPASGGGPLNMVPVDYVVEALYALSLNPAAEGRTFHLVDPNPLSTIRAFELVAMAAGKPLPTRLPRPLTRFVKNIPFMERALQTGQTMLEGADHSLTFNAMNTAELTRSGPWCPPFSDYVEALVEHLRSR